MIHILLSMLNFGGTFVFAISGALAAVKNRMDIFGIFVLSFATGNAGGITRDVLIGAIPPAALSNVSYLGVSILAGLIVFFRSSTITRFNRTILWFDAVGLAVFAVAGAQKALSYGLSPVMSALLGMLTGIGGGMLRDLLVMQIPTVLRADLYALAALIGAAIVVGGSELHIQPVASTIVGGIACFALRYMAIRHGWHLPEARQSNDKSQ